MKFTLDGRCHVLADSQAPPHANVSVLPGERPGALSSIVATVSFTALSPEPGLDLAHGRPSLNVY